MESHLCGNRWIYFGYKINDCAKHHPIIVSEIISKDLPVFWRPRQSLRRQNSGAVVNATSGKKNSIVKKEKKKACVQCLCSLGRCQDLKVPMGAALMHFSMYQLKGDNDSAICAYCGKDHDVTTTNVGGEVGHLQNPYLVFDFRVLRNVFTLQ